MSEYYGAPNDFRAYVAHSSVVNNGKDKKVLASILSLYNLNDLTDELYNVLSLNDYNNLIRNGRSYAMAATILRRYGVILNKMYDPKRRNEYSYTERKE